METKNEYAEAIRKLLAEATLEELIFVYYYLITK